jgi:hypothetical protein
MGSTPEAKKSIMELGPNGREEYNTGMNTARSPLGWLHCLLAVLIVFAGLKDAWATEPLDESRYLVRVEETALENEFGEDLRASDDPGLPSELSLRQPCVFVGKSSPFGSSFRPLPLWPPCAAPPTGPPLSF